MRAHAISCFSFLDQNGGVRKFGYLGYRGYFSPTFINPIFRFSPIVKYENLDYKKSEIFKHLFDIHLQSNIKT